MARGGQRASRGTDCERVGRRTEHGQVLEDVELELDNVVGVDLADESGGLCQHLQPAATAESRTQRRTQYLVVWRTNAFWLPPAPESPSTGCPRVRTRSYSFDSLTMMAS